MPLPAGNSLPVVQLFLVKKLSRLLLISSTDERSVWCTNRAEAVLKSKRILHNFRQFGIT